MAVKWAESNGWILKIGQTRPTEPSRGHTPSVCLWESKLYIGVKTKRLRKIDMYRAAEKEAKTNPKFTLVKFRNRVLEISKDDLYL